MSATEQLALRIERVFNAPRRRVFAAFTEPEQIRQWSAPVGARVAEGEGVVSPGERWRVVMEDETSGQRYVALGTYLEVEPPRWLRYTHGWQGEGETFEDVAAHATVVTVEMFDEGGRTRVVMIQTGFESIASRDGHDQGWTSCFSKLETLLGN